jgi:hypothetical protein
MRLTFAAGIPVPLLFLCACAESDTPRVEAAPSPQPAEIVADFRSGPEPVIAKSATSSIDYVALAFGSPAPDDVQVASVIDGTFTSAERVQSAALLTRGGPLAGPDAKPSMLVVTDGKRVAAQFVPPDIVYHSIAAVLDADGDGLDDVVLTAQSYQMGQTAMRADVLSLANGQRRTITSLGTVYENTCDVPLGDKAVRAAVVKRNRGGQLVKESMSAPCRDDGSAPAEAAFTIESSRPL